MRHYYQHRDQRTMSKTTNAELSVTQFCDQVPPYLICAICQGVATDPVEHNVCDTVFCRGCYDRCSNSTCPTCQQSMHNGRKNANRHILSIYNALTVKCKHSADCLFKLEDILLHDETCMYAQVHCPNDRCIFNIAQRLMRKDLFEHSKCCEYRQISCKDCALLISARSFAAHSRVCENRRVECAKCKATIQHCEIASHEVCCPMVLILCPVQGCNEKVPRKDLQKHYEANGPDHINRLLSQVANLEKRIRSATCDKQPPTALASQGDSTTVEPTGKPTETDIPDRAESCSDPEYEGPVESSLTSQSPISTATPRAFDSAALSGLVGVQTAVVATDVGPVSEFLRAMRQVQPLKVFVFRGRNYTVREDGYLYDDVHNCTLKKCASCKYARPDNAIARFFDGFTATADVGVHFPPRAPWKCGRCSGRGRAYDDWGDM